jgi:hypothetical protein
VVGSDYEGLRCAHGRGEQGKGGVMVKVLTNLRIDEVSAVDRGAGDGVKIVLMKRDDRPRSKPHVERAARAKRHRYGAYLKIFASKADDGNGDDANVGVSDHHASKVADLLVESGKYPHRAAALDHLLHSSRGAALLQRLHKAAETEKESPSMKSYERWQDIVKSHGVNGLVEVAKNITDAEESFGITEIEFVNLIDIASRAAHPELGARALEKVYECNPVLARAINVIKAWPMPMSLEPMVATGASGFPSTRMRSGSSPGRGDDSGDVDSVGVSDAYEQLVKMAEQQRRAGESASQAFERVYLDPGNRHLAEAERSANRPQPTTYFPMPVK